VISGNSLFGVRIYNSQENVVAGNNIGTDASGKSPIPNEGAGVDITLLATLNVVGGDAASEANTIAFNGGSGVQVGWAPDNGSYENAILGNSIFDNSGLGIDLNADGTASTNDSGDADDGANGLLNYPDITSADSTGGSITIDAKIDSGLANTEFTVQYFASPACDSAGHGEGQTYLGSASHTTNGAGDATFSDVLAFSVPKGYVVTATASTKTTTSEFSVCMVVTGDAAELVNNGGKEGRQGQRE
jgi:hypothetical protein